jgi:F0F1-type ATP synthase assembly protein I
MDAAARNPDRVERGQRRLRLILLFVLLPAVVGGLVVGVAMGGENTGIFDGDPPRWASNLGLVLVLLGVVIEVAAAIWLVATGRYRSGRQSPLIGLSWSHRRRLDRQVRRDAPESNEDRALLVETARQFVGQRYLAVLCAGLLMTSIGQVFVGSAPFHTMIGGLLGLIWVVLIVSVLRNARRGEAFLRNHRDLSER